MRLALIGATGLVGEVMMRVLEERRFPVTSFFPAASERSVGKRVLFHGNHYQVCGMRDALDARPDLALFSAGAAVSREWAAAFARQGCRVIDNSSAWRSAPEVPLLVPEVNAHALKDQDHLIANPNCSTIQLVVALAPLHRRFALSRLVIATYQSVSGTGVQAVRQLEDERAGKPGPRAYPWPIDLNCFPHGGEFLDNGYTAEEMKLVNETRKILEAPALQVTATVVRIPVTGGHSEAVNASFERPFSMEEVRRLLGEGQGINVQDEPAKNIYPMPLHAAGKDDVFVGRIRRDISQSNGLDLWIVADNLRKGAATNAVQIAQLLTERGLLP